MKVLISGGTGLIGKRLSAKLIAKNHEVAWLSRAPKQGNIKQFEWNPKNNTIDSEAIEWADAIIHLAGASVAGNRWSDAYKKEIYDSRITSTRLLVHTVNSAQVPPPTLISASATGFYGAYTSHNGAFSETANAADDFLAKVTHDWEREVFKAEPTIRVVALRIGIVLAEKGGALEQMATPIKWGIGAPLASGKQIMSWIHIDDLVDLFIFCLEQPHLSGVYNAVSPNAVSNIEMTKAIAAQLKRPLWLPPVPEFALKILLGEFASFVTRGVRVSAEKIQMAGFRFKYPILSDALNNLLTK